MKADTTVQSGDGTSKHFNSTHGYASGPHKSRIYIVWRNMKARCSNQNNARYGGRGIKVCSRWASSFETFLGDMGIGKPGWTLERIENNGNYEIFNCVWATPRRQANNRGSNVYLEFQGLRMTMADWAAKQGIALATLHRRLKCGWSVQDALTTPVR